MPALPLPVDIVRVENEVWRMTRKNVIVHTFPIDYLAWTAQTYKIAAAVEKNPQAKNRELWLEGSASPDANKALSIRGWSGRHSHFGPDDC